MQNTKLLKRMRAIYKPPYGYDSTEEGNLIPIEDELELLAEVADMVEERALSLRDAALWLSHKTGRKISHEGLRKRLMQPVRIDDGSEG